MTEARGKSSGWAFREAQADQPTAGLESLERHFIRQYRTYPKTRCLQRVGNIKDIPAGVAKSMLSVATAVLHTFGVLRQLSCTVSRLELRRIGSF